MHPDGNYNELDEFRGVMADPGDGLSATPSTGTGTVDETAPDDMTLTVAELKALTGDAAGDLRFVYDSTYGWGVYRYTAGTNAEDAPEIYRPDNYAGLGTKYVWVKVL